VNFCHNISHKKFNLDHNTKFNNDIRKEDYLKVAPSASSITNLNKGGDIIFQSLQSSNPLDLPNAFLYFKIKLEDVDPNCTLENNFFPSLFSLMRLKLGTTEVEYINDPGIYSSMLNFVKTSDEYKRVYGEISGWIPEKVLADKTNKSFTRRVQLYSVTKTFDGMFPLKTLFGFLENYNRVVHLLPIELIMNRKIDNEIIFFGDQKAGLKLTIIELQLWIPEITLNPSLELKVLDRLHSDKPIMVDFLNRITSLIDIPSGSTFSWKPTNCPGRPRYIFIGFKNTKISHTENNSLFIQSYNGGDLHSLRVQLNNSYYPINNLEFSFKKNYQLQPYLNYINMCKNFGNEPQLSYSDFKNLYSIFCFDVSAQSDNLVINGCDVTIHITKDNLFTPKCYCLVLEEKHIDINLKGGRLNIV